MKNRIISLFTVLAFMFGLLPAMPVTASANAVTGRTAAQIVEAVTVGFNIGNQFDATHYLGGYRPNDSVTSLETAWVGGTGHAITESYIDTLKAQGFNTIRLPVTWHKVADPNNNYQIRADWMKRVREVVDWIYGKGMYVILNSHHDSVIFKLGNSDYAESEKALTSVWKQIAAEFRGYDQRLIFEGMNEPRTYNSAQEWNGGTAEERANLNKLNQAFVDTVRADSGNNNKGRVLMVPTYAASAGANAVNGFTLPADTIAGRLIVSIHTYDPYHFALNTDPDDPWWTDKFDRNNVSDRSAITQSLDRVHNAFVSKGTPVILGEFGSVNKNNTAAREVHAQYYVEYAKSKGMRCVWWDNSGFNMANKGSETFGIVRRNNNQVVYPGIIEAMLKNFPSDANTDNGGSAGGNSDNVGSAGGNATQSQTFSISYTLNGGVNPVNAPYTYTQGRSTTLPTPSRTGYAFDGWYTSSAFTGNKLTSTGTTRTGNLKLHAKWTELPAAPRSPKTAAVSDSSVSVSWSRVDNADGYEVWRSTSRTGTYTRVRTVTSGTVTSLRDSRLKADTQYFYKVRAYKTMNGKRIYGGYSAVRAATTLPLTL